jgi:predicted transcriptional regulator
MQDVNSPLNATPPLPEATPKKKFSRGIRPDHIARGEALPVFNSVIPSDQSATNRVQTGNKPSTEPTKVEIPIEFNHEFLIKTVSKVAANDEQTVSKVAANDEQTVSKVAANDEQTVSKVAASVVLPQVAPLETVSATVSTTVSKVVANREQTVSKVVAEFSLSALVGLQRQILIFLFTESQANRSDISSPMTLEHLVEQFGSTEKTVKNAIYRLTKKSLISRVEYKNGRGGWTRYKISKDAFQEILRNDTVSKVVANRKQTVSKVPAKPEAQPEAASPVVVVSSNNLNTTNTEAPDDPCFVIPNDLSGLISRRQLSEFIREGKTSEWELQVSLDAFAYDLRNKLITMRNSSNPVSILIGEIKNNGSYNSAKYVETLKNELKPLIQTQKETSLKKEELKNPKEWARFQKFKLEQQPDYEILEAKYKKVGFAGDMLEDFIFLDFIKQKSDLGIQPGEESS